MTCRVFNVGGATVIACGRAPKRRCATCRADTELLCDGCDRPVCPQCSVGPVSSQDFCPDCFKPAWKEWLKSRTTFYLGEGDVVRDARRRDFRAWVRANPQRFAELVPMSRAGRAAVEKGSAA